MSERPHAPPQTGTNTWKTLLRALFSLALLAIVYLVVDEEVLIDRISALDPVWILVALFATIPQYLLSAARWQLTSKRLGASLTFRIALTEYYLAVLTNQILPGGVLGDASLEARHVVEEPPARREHAKRVATAGHGRFDLVGQRSEPRDR